MRDFIDKEKRSTIMETSKIERLRDMKKNEEKQQETAKEKMSRKKLLCVIGIPVGILVVIYLVLALFFQSHFAFRTTINNVGVSASSTSGVEKKITKQASRYERNWWSVRIRQRASVEQTLTWSRYLISR